jgi:phospholipid transport system transporter-binding protein
LSDGAGVSHRVRGPVTFENLMALRAEGDEVIAAATGPVRMQLEDLDGGSSAAVALLMAWFRSATAREKAIEFVDVPKEVRKIIELSGMTEVLPLVESAAAAASD